MSDQNNKDWLKDFLKVILMIVAVIVGIIVIGLGLIVGVCTFGRR